MARVSKKVSAAQREAENAQHRIWKTAIYARLSDFDDVLRNTESLEVQISYIKEYINHRDDLMLLDVFADKRCTGMNFDRPEFERLLKALQERKVNCIVVKDFSRLGRNFVETGQYKEKFLELKQDAENEIEAFRQTKAENEKELVVVQEELRQKKQIADNTEVLLTADNLQQYVKKIEVDREKITCTEFSF